MTTNNNNNNNNNNNTNKSYNWMHMLYIYQDTIWVLVNMFDGNTPVTRHLVLIPVMHINTSYTIVGHWTVIQGSLQFVKQLVSSQAKSSRFIHIWPNTINNQSNVIWDVVIPSCKLMQMLLKVIERFLKVNEIVWKAMTRSLKIITGSLAVIKRLLAVIKKSQKIIRQNE